MHLMLCPVSSSNEGQMLSEECNKRMSVCWFFSRVLQTACSLWLRASGVSLVFKWRDCFYMALTCLCFSLCKLLASKHHAVRSFIAWLSTVWGPIPFCWVPAIGREKISGSFCHVVSQRTFFLLKSQLFWVVLLFVWKPSKPSSWECNPKVTFNCNWPEGSKVARQSGKQKWLVKVSMHGQHRCKSLICLRGLVKMAALDSKTSSLIMLAILKSWFS